MNIIFDLGGVLMQHNMSGCIRKMTALLGEEGMQRVLGLCPNGEGVADSLMDKYECGLVTEDEFIDTIHRACVAGTSREQIIDAWVTMHAGIPDECWTFLKKLKEKGHQLFVLSNNNETHYKDILEHYDMSVFEHVFLSHELHYRKPERGIYEAVDSYFKSHGIDKEPVVFIDDIAQNRAMGEQFGWKTGENIHFLDKIFA
ncbi:MAG: HAD hydrolase-like protein [Paludibacteraceae bacterium]|nr:HAD hydrolase-like protein [Paludibacteraceae bacterium]